MKSKAQTKPKNERPIIEFEGKKYIFSINSIIILAVGAPILAFLIYLFFDNEANYWLHEIVVKQTVFLLNLIFNMGADSYYVGSGKYHWMFQIPNRAGIFFETFCTGVQAICVFAGIIICTPHSQDPDTNEDIIWRKTKSLIVSSVIFYVVNIIRMLIQIYLYYIGYAWEDIHYSISAASSFIAAIIILLLHKWIPEFILSIIYTGTLISEPIKQKRKEKLETALEESKIVDNELIRKYLAIDKKFFYSRIKSIADFLGGSLEDNNIILPQSKSSEIMEDLNKIREKYKSGTIGEIINV